MSFLSTVGKDIKGVFAWLGTPTGQAVVTSAETAIELACPAATGAIALINAWGTEAIKVETLAVAASATTGSSATKAAAVISTMTPQVLAWAATNGYPVPNSTQITAINTAVVNVLNLLGAPATTAPTTEATPAVPAIAA